MKTERVTLLTSADFKGYLVAEAAREGVSVAALVRSRCERKPDADEAMLAALAGELRKAVGEAQASLRDGLAEAEAVLSDLRELRLRRQAAANVALDHAPAHPERKAAARVRA